MRFATLSLAAPLVLAGITSAQGINLDLGTFHPVPPAAYGAAAPQPGTWNQLGSVPVGSSLALVDLAAAPTGVVVTLTAGAPPTLFNFNNAGTAGNDELLMDDAVDPGTLAAVYTFSGLAAGSYDVVTYAWAPDSATLFSNVSVNGLPVQVVGGAWPGGFALGITHALHNVTIVAGQNIVMTMSVQTGFATFNGIQLKPLGGGAVGTPECIGDTTAACPCSGAGGTNVPNPGAAGNGCANSSFAAGANLSATGNAVDNAGDTLVLTCNNMPGPGLFIQSNALGGPFVNFNDGILCAAVGIIRMGVVFPTAGVASYPGGLTPAPIHIAGAPVLAPTTTKHYQCWYRDITVGFCNTLGHNMSNGLAIVWAP